MVCASVDRRLGAVDGSEAEGGNHAAVLADLYVPFDANCFLRVRFGEVAILARPRARSLVLCRC